MLKPVFKVPRRVARYQTSESGSRARKIVGMDQPFGALADQFVDRPTERGAPSGIDANDASGRVADDEQVLGDIPNAIPLLRLRLDTLGQHGIKAAEPLLRSRNGGLSALAFGDLLGRDVDANDQAAAVFQGMPVGDPDAILVGAVGPLAVDFDAGDGLAGTHNRPDELFHLIGHFRDRLAYRPSNVIGDGQAANLRQVLIDHHVTAIRAEKRQPDRRRLVD